MQALKLHFSDDARKLLYAFENASGIPLLDPQSTLSASVNLYCRVFLAAYTDKFEVFWYRGEKKRHKAQIVRLGRGEIYDTKNVVHIPLSDKACEMIGKVKEASEVFGDGVLWEEQIIASAIRFTLLSLPCLPDAKIKFFRDGMEVKEAPVAKIVLKRSR